MRVRERGRGPNRRKVGGGQEVDSEGGLGVKEIGSQGRKNRATAALASVAEVWSRGDVRCRWGRRAAVAERCGERHGGADGFSDEHVASVVA
jgi:hypothetical protein